jgi:hypothetical protein
MTAPTAVPVTRSRDVTGPPAELGWLAQVMAETDDFIRESRERSGRSGESELLRTLAL